MFSDLLFVNWNLNPEIFRIGGFALRWYSLLFVGGFILGYYLFRWFCRNEGVDEKMVDPFLYTTLIATIIGSRLGHCLFYQPDYYLSSWEGVLEIFQPWKGGLASHGGAIALLLAVWWFSAHYGKKYSVDYLWLMDRLCLTVAFAGCFIRLGNLCNSEIYGDVTNLPWGFVFERNGETEPKHPTQLYEALSYLLLGLVMLHLYYRDLKKLYRGTLFGLFFLWCFGSRFLIEFIKEPQVEFENQMLLNMGQLLSIPCILFGIGMLIFSFRRQIPAKAIVTVAKPGKKEPTHYAKPLNQA